MTDKCEILDCNNEASRITTTETKYIEVCTECYEKKFKK